MKRKIISVLLCCIFFVAVCTSCTSLGMLLQGEQYFVGKTEDNLIKYFGEPGVELSDKTEYGKVVRFCNQINTLYMDKTTVKTYKDTTSECIFSLDFVEYNDGCLVLNGGNHYSGGAMRTRTIPAVLPKHRNDNAAVKNELNRFWSEVKRLNAVPENDQDARFNNTRIGSWYFVYKKNHNNRWYPGNSYAGELSYSVPFYHYRIWRVDVVSRQKEITDTKIAYVFNLKTRTYSDAAGKQISESQAAANETHYEKGGYKRRLTKKGMTLDAYITAGKIIRIEKK